MRRVFLVMLLLLSWSLSAQYIKIPEAVFLELEQLNQAQAEALTILEDQLTVLEKQLQSLESQQKTLKLQISELEKYSQGLEKENRNLTTLATIEGVGLAGVVIGIVIYAILK